MTAPSEHGLAMDLQRIEEIYVSVLQAIIQAESFHQQRALARWCDAQALRFQRLGSKALEKESA